MGSRDACQACSGILSSTVNRPRLPRTLQSLESASFMQGQWRTLLTASFALYWTCIACARFLRLCSTRAVLGSGRWPALAIVSAQAYCSCVQLSCSSFVPVVCCRSPGASSAFAMGMPAARAAELSATPDRLLSLQTSTGRRAAVVSADDPWLRVLCVERSREASMLVAWLLASAVKLRRREQSVLCLALLCSK